ncbi:heparanase-like protein 3 [Beta vulgaris subsp. vulgaris]|uniref:heparanase-like protein 3 n=1 Tax=Beta vulgaris subsp. vulgaris TaxID=3555 RepID=UPI0020368D3A|nr:heparanase-like protein 3 [Beta vulgaris subsp. vulgaris]
MNFLFLLFLCFTFKIIDCSSLNQQHEDLATISIDTKASIAETDEDYICATMDFYMFIPEPASLLDVDLNNKILINAVKAFSPLILRLGGTLEDKLSYEEKGQKQCVGFVPDPAEMFEFKPACLPMARWDQLNNFFDQTGVKVVFGLNALYGKKIVNGITQGLWDSSNAETLIRHTVNKGYNKIIGWELGNELNGAGVGASVPSDQYAKDVNTLQNLVQKIYNSSQNKPIVLGPGGFFNSLTWFEDFLKKSTNTLQAVTHHVYNLGPGEDEHMMNKIFDPVYLDTGAQVYLDLQNLLGKLKSPIVAWVGEAGGAWHGGHDLVTNVFASGFWFLDQLGMAATFNTKAFCRQALIGGHYGLLNTTTFLPNPDYYNALLWHRLMGKQVLATKVIGNPKIRAYTHCSKQSEGITLLIINLDNKPFKISVETQDGPITNPSKPTITTEVYQLTAPNADLRSKTVLLNGQALLLTSLGEIPQLIPQKVSYGSTIDVAAYSIVFVHFPEISSPACKM